MIAGDYITPTIRLVRLLGRGGMGSVWVAEHRGLGIEVAVKLISPSFAEEQDFVRRFQCEAMVAATIHVPNVAHVHDYGVTGDGVPFIIMELLEGEDLRQQIRREGPLDPSKVIAIVYQVAKALGRAHQLGIVHRDIKPDNIFLLMDIDGELLVKVLDFGIAKIGLADVGMTSSGAILGTPGYMSPEQFVSTRSVDFRADLWSLGAVVYHALTGMLPFAGETMVELAVNIQSGPIPKAREIRHDLPEAIDAWFERAFSRDPAGRFASARQMAEKLDQALRGFSPSPRTGASAQSSATVLMETLSWPSRSSFSSTARTASATPRGTAGARSRAMTSSLIALFTITGLVVIGLASWGRFNRGFLAGDAIEATNVINASFHPGGALLTATAVMSAPVAAELLNQSAPAFTAKALASIPLSTARSSPSSMPRGGAHLRTSGYGAPQAAAKVSPATSASDAPPSQPPEMAPTPPSVATSAPAPPPAAPPPSLPPSNDPYG